MVEIVRGYVAAELEPVLAENRALSERVATLEAREVAEPFGVSGTQDGARIELEFTQGDVRDVVEFQLPAGPAGEDGEPGEKGERGEPGALPAVEAWADTVHYAGQVRSHAGGTWQALHDTAREPPHEDWICLASRGADGADGLSLNPRRLWDADEEYRRLDIVALNGSSFVAVKDDPGTCPGEGWMLVTSPGKRGERGEPGAKGDRGPAGPVVTSLEVDDEGVLTLANADGSIVRCDLYPLLDKIAKGRT